MAVYNPAASDVHVNRPLTNILTGYHNSRYIADLIFPMVTVPKQSDIIAAMKQSAFFRNEGSVPIGEGGVAADIGYEVDTTPTYFCNKYGLRKIITDDHRTNQDAPFNADRDVALLLADKLEMVRERAFVSDFWKTGVWKTDKTGTTDFVKWSTYGTSSPIEDMREYSRTIRRLTGTEPNTFVLGDLTFDVLLDHPDVLERIVYTERGIASEALLASLFNVERILVGKSVYTADPEGTAEASVTYTASWDDDALLMYVAPRPMIWQPSAGYTFVWNTGVGAGIQWVRKYRDEPAMGDWVEVRSYFDQKAVATPSGLFISDAVD